MALLSTQPCMLECWKKKKALPVSFQITAACNVVLPRGPSWAGDLLLCKMWTITSLNPLHSHEKWSFTSIILRIWKIWALLDQMFHHIDNMIIMYSLMQRRILLIVHLLQHLLDHIFEVFLESFCTSIKTSTMGACPYLAAICKGVSPLTLACHSSGGHFLRISMTNSVDFESFD